MSTVEEIERAVEKLPPADFAKLAAWIEFRSAEDGRTPPVLPGETNGDWFDVYMGCPHPFELPPRKKQFYRPEA